MTDIVTSANARLAAASSIEAVNKGTLVNEAIKAATNAPTLIAGLAAVDPALASQLTGKAMIASKTPYGMALSLGIAWAVKHYGLGWGPDFDDLVSGGIVLGAAIVLRKITNSPITGWFKGPAASAPVPTTGVQS